MNTFKRVLAGIVIFICILGMILGLVGIVAVWYVNPPLTDSLTGMLDQAEVVLVFTQDQLGKVDSQLEEAQDHLTTLDQIVTESGEQLIENSPTMQLVSNLVGVELVSKIETTAEVIGTIRGTITSVNSTLGTIRRIPFISVPTLQLERLAVIDQRMQDLVNDVRTLAKTVDDIENGVIDRSTKVIIVQTDRLNKRIENVQTPIVNFNLRLSNVESRVANAKARIPVLIDWVSILLTLLILWFILAQASLLYLGWYFWKLGTLPVINNTTD